MFYTANKMFFSARFHLEFSVAEIDLFFDRGMAMDDGRFREVWWLRALPRPLRLRSGTDRPPRLGKDSTMW